MSFASLLYTTLFGSILFARQSWSFNFTIEPADHIVAIGSTLLLNCQAQHSGPQPVDISWKNNANWLVDPTNKPWTQLVNNSLFYSSIPANSIGTFLCGATVRGTSQIIYSRTASVREAYIHSQYSTHPVNTTKRLGETAFFDCVIEESLPYASIHWEKDGNYFARGELHYIPNKKSTSSAISVGSLTFSNVGWYGCVAVNPLLPNQPQKSRTAYLTVQPSQDKPHFGIHPTSTVVAEHLPALLQCHILGIPPPTISWTFNGQPVQNGFDRYILSNGSLYFTAPVNRSYAGQYACNGANTAGSVSSGTVLFRVAYFDFSFIENPKDHTAVVGDAVNLLCVPPISFPVDVTIHWYHNYSQITPGPDVSIDSSGTIKFASIKKSDEGIYFCDGKNHILGVSRTSLPAFVTVHVPPSFQVRPQGTNVTTGSSLILHCRASGSPYPSVTWQKDGHSIDTSHATLLSNGSLYIASSAVQDAGRYSCRATNIAGSASVMAYIIIYVPPSLLKPPVNVTKTVGETVRFNCSFSGIPRPHIRWFFHSGVSTVQLTQTGDHYVITNGLLEILQIRKEREGKYICQAVNIAGQTQAEAYLTVKVPASIDFHPVNVTVNESSSASFQCNASGDPKPVVIWFNRGMQLSGGGRFVIYENSLTILHTVASDAGEYSCNVSNGLDSHVGVAHLLVQVSPNITSFHIPQFVHFGANATLVCDVSGIPQPTVTWYRNDIVQSHVRHVSSGVFFISSVVESDTGLYTCVALNAAGILSRQNNLTVQVAPSSLVQVSAIPLSSTVIQLSWKPGFDGHSPVTGFKLERKRESGSFMLLEDNVTVNSYRVGNLDPHTTYTFRISARNAIGVGPGATVTNKTLQDAPSPPQNVVAVPYNSTAVHVTWNAPVTPNGQITQYEIQHNTAGSADVATIVLSANQLPELRSLIGSLKAFTLYEIRIRAATQEGNILWGNFSLPAEVTTGEAAPISAPQNVQLEVLATPKHSILIKWKRVPPELSNGKVRRYVVFIKATGPYRFSEAQNISAGTALNLTIKGLFAWTKYNISVQAVTIRPGPMTPWKQVQTFEDVPGLPSNVTLISDSQQSFLVIITPPLPEERNGVVIGYTVFYRRTNSLPAAGNLSVSTTNSTVRLTNLTVFTEYSVKVAARTGAGQGKESPVKTIFTQEGIPGTVDDVTVIAVAFDTIKVTWRDPVTPNGKIVQYRVTYNTSEGNSANVLVPADKREVTIDNLTPNTTYFIFVTAKTSKGFGKYNTVVNASTGMLPLPPVTKRTEPPVTTTSSLGIAAATEASTGLDKEQMIIVVVCVGVIVLLIIGAAVYFLGIRRSKKGKAVGYTRHKKNRNVRNPVFQMERPRLDVQEEPSVAETNYSSDSFDSDWDTSVASPQSTDSRGNVTQKHEDPPMQSSAAPRAGRSPMVRLRGKTVDSQDSQFDPTYSSVEELGGGFSSFGPLPPVEFRTTPIEEREPEIDTLQNPSSSYSRMSFTNELFNAVRDPEDVDFEKRVANQEGYQEKDITGLANRGYDSDKEEREENLERTSTSGAKKPAVSTVPKNIEELYAKVDKTKRNRNRRKDSSSSGSEGSHDASRGPSRLDDIQAAPDVSAQICQVSGHAKKPAHDPVVVYDERTNLDVEARPERAKRSFVKPDALSVGRESNLSSATFVSDLNSSEATDPVLSEQHVNLNHEPSQEPRVESPPHSPFVLRNRKLSVDSEDSFYDQPYSSLEEINAGAAPALTLGTPSPETLESALNGAEADNVLNLQDSFPMTANTTSALTKPYGVMDKEEDEAVVLEVKDIEIQNTSEDSDEALDDLLRNEPATEPDQIPSTFLRSDGVDSTVLMF